MTAREQRLQLLRTRLACQPGGDRFTMTQTGLDRYRIGPAHEAYRLIVPLLVQHGGRFGTLVATDERARGGGFLLRTVVLFDQEGLIIEVQEGCSATLPVLTSIAQWVPAAHWQEREAAEMFGLQLADHPEPLRHLLHEHTAWDYHPLCKDVPLEQPVPTARAWPPRFLDVRGEGVYEIPVGPIHAGIIEPGHFRFFGLGERILHLSIRLGWQHKGIEKLFEGLQPQAGVRLAERISGDTSFGHALAFCRALEDLAGTPAPSRAAHLRALAMELERLANHVGDLGGLCTDIGFAFGAAHFGRLRGEFLNRAEALTGSRFLRGFCCPGGVRSDLDGPVIEELRAWVKRVRDDLQSVVSRTFEAETVIARMTHVGVLTRRTARAFGVVGPAARASGIKIDVRRDHACAPYDALGVTPVVETDGDVAARARLRHGEALQSLELIDRILTTLPPGPIVTPPGPLPPFTIGLGHVEAWRGEVLTVVIVGDDGLLWRVRVRDPSVQNWIGLALAVEVNEVSDFPLCNKSFNLSYSGSDL
ncbi:MAG: NADH-quinone oxidoreductase subunit C [Candidatus Riflebacteria bacterium]|nr:NADH-quinone oxidoreductase subunit C [Candidatus Riflebacteria bacterium]